MSSSETLGKKKLSEIIEGDRIAFRANQLVNWQSSYSKPHLALTATVIRINDVEGSRQVVTASGTLTAYPDDMEFEVVGSDYDTTATQMQYAVAAPEKFNGISIE
jgi:hypothetical protein